MKRLQPKDVGTLKFSRARKSLQGARCPGTKDAVATFVARGRKLQTGEGGRGIYIPSKGLHVTLAVKLR